MHSRVGCSIHMPLGGWHTDQPVMMDNIMQCDLRTKVIHAMAWLRTMMLMELEF